MSEFLMVVPPGWTQLDWEAVRAAHPDLNKGNVENWINTNQISYIDMLLKEIAMIPDTMSVLQAKLIDDAYFLVKFAE